MKRGFVRTLLQTVLIVGVSLPVLAGTADAAGDYYVTFVARKCPSYSDIYANRARNDAAESLQALGPKTQYGNTGALVSPTYEEIGRELKCKPLVNWAFTLGTGYGSRAVSGAWGSMSRVTNPYRKPVRTRRSTPLLDDKGKRLAGAAPISGAVTIKLTSGQESEAAKNRLWVQGGVPTDPVLAHAHGTPSTPGYGFGTLRCAADDVNGDNVAYLFFPSGINHVFCYAYYVPSPLSSGTIIIHDRVEGGPAGADPAFAFTGNVSYDPDGFTLKRGQRIAFQRGAGATWQVTESTLSHYQLKSVDCRSAAGASTISTGDTTASVGLAAGDTVDCTFVNRWIPPAGTLTLFNTTLGGVGSFGYIVGPYNDDPTLVTTTSRRSGVPVEARPEGNLALYATTRYIIQELPPPHPGGRWTLVSAVCGGAPRNVRNITFWLVFGKGTVCTFVNRFTPAGSIRLTSVTEGGTGAAAFVVQSLGSTPRQFRQLATARGEGAAVIAVPDAPPDATRHVYLGTYLISEQPPLHAPAGNGWSLTAVTCNGRKMHVRQGSVRVNLSRRASHIACEFRSRLEASATRDASGRELNGVR
ncbi:MAG TPA: hypothetical protein VMV16_06200 [Solirubrobacteraceae bacterium]|nr:hypothetical protein [Solirubrobacteraceae bacterium]